MHLAKGKKPDLNGSILMAFRKRQTNKIAVVARTEGKDRGAVTKGQH